ncbi:MAG: hypothetical protein HQM06_08845, partial [Magnetococcales bacterium]|nr:hypothetical protein [Magnetococcales bacterium]
MSASSDDPWQELLNHLRQRSGITPVPLSAEERQSGLLASMLPATTLPASNRPTLAEQGVSLQSLLSYLREQTGITPIPLSAAERQSGILHAFSTPPRPTPTPTAT